MYVCICHDVKDTQIKTAIHQGQDSLDKLQSSLQVGTCCGCCLPMVNELLEHHKSRALAVDIMAS